MTQHSTNLVAVKALQIARSSRISSNVGTQPFRFFYSTRHHKVFQTGF